jgi:hypothetical protein
MGVDFGLAAADQYYKADDARVLREQQRAKADAELSLLPDRVEAERSQYQLQGAQNRANLDLVPNQAKVAKALSDYSVEELPSKIAQLRQQRIFSDVDAQATGIGKLAVLIQIGDPKQVINYLNDWRQNNPHDKNQAEVVSVGFEKDPATGENVFKALDANGNPVMQMSASQIQRVRDSIGKTELRVLNEGSTLVGVKNGQPTTLATSPKTYKPEVRVAPAGADVVSVQNGKAEIVATNPAAPKGSAAANSPAAKLTGLINLYKGMGYSEADAEKRASLMSTQMKDKSPQRMVAELYEASLKTTFNASPETKAKLLKQAESEVRAIQNMFQQNTPAPQSNSSTPPKIDSRVNSLIGIPSQ